MTTRHAIWPGMLLTALMAGLLAAACSSSDGPGDFSEPPLISEEEAIGLAQNRFQSFIDRQIAQGRVSAVVTVRPMRLRTLQDLMNSAVYGPTSRLLDREIWAVQIGGNFPGRPETGDNPVAVIGIDTQDGATLIRGTFDQEILPLAGQ